MRHLRSVLVVAAALLSTTARAEQWQHTYIVSGKPAVAVDTSDGDLEVVVGRSEQVAVRITAHGWKINQDLKVDGKQSGNRVELNLHHGHRDCFGFCFDSIRVEIQVPRESDLNLHTGDGTVRVEEVRGSFRVRTNDGDIHMKDIEGQLDADTGDGNVQVSGRLDLVNLRTGDGDIKAEIRASSTPQPSWSLRTGDGDLDLRLPSQFAADVYAHTGDGEVKIDFPLTASGPNQETTVRGKINGGGIPIELRTGDGDIHVERL